MLERNCTRRDSGGWSSLLIDASSAHADNQRGAAVAAVSLTVFDVRLP